MEWVRGTVRDEAGRGFDTLTSGELVFPAKFDVSELNSQLEAVRELPYQQGDILICNYGKTGSHWVNNLVHFLVTPGPMEQVQPVVPNYIDVYPLDEAKNQSPPRVFLSHLVPERLPRQHLEERGPVVLVTRNPRDTLVSYKYHISKHEFYDYADIEWNALIENWIDGKVPMCSYFEYYRRWKRYITEKQPNHIVIHYENLIENGLAELRRLSDFLSVHNTDERLRQILDRCSFDRLKKDTESGKVITKLVDKEGRPFLYRKGIVGDWKNYFTVAQSERFDALEESYKEDIF